MNVRPRRRGRASRLVVAILAAVLPVFGCSEGICTTVGCDSQVKFELDRPLEPDQAFLASHAGIAGDVILRLPQGTYDGTHEVRLELTSDVGETLAETRTRTEFTRSQPNGPGCAPVCWQATVPVSR